MKSSSNINGNAAGSNVGGQAVKGPDEDKIKEILERTGYTLDVTTGQRKFGGPPPGWEGEPPSNGCEVSILTMRSNAVFFVSYRFLNPKSPYYQ